VNDSNGLIPVGTALLAGFLTYVATIHREHITTARERETKRAEQEAERVRVHNRFQAKTLMAAQKLAARLVELMLEHLAIIDRPKEPTLYAGFAGDDIRKAAVGAWNTSNELALIRERIIDDDLRDKLKALQLTLFKYRASGVLDREKMEVLKDIDKHFSDANNRLGELLRKLI
jgi:hypothetical protein